MVLLELTPNWWVRADMMSNIHIARESNGGSVFRYGVRFLLAGNGGFFEWSCKSEAEARERVAYIVSRLLHSDGDSCVAYDRRAEADWRKLNGDKHRAPKETA